MQINILSKGEHYEFRSQQNRDEEQGQAKKIGKTLDRGIESR